MSVVSVQTETYTTLPVKVEDGAFLSFNKEINKLGGFIAGGCARHLVEKNSVIWLDDEIEGDIDIFCSEVAVFDELAQFFGSKESEYLLGKSIQYHNDTKYSRTFFIRGTAVQLIKPIELPGRVLYGRILDVLDGFDLTVCQAALVTDSIVDMKAIVSQRFLEDSKNNVVRFNRIHTDLIPENRDESMVSWPGFRLQYYQNKGYTVPQSEVMKLISENGGWITSSEKVRANVIDIMRKNPDDPISKKQLSFLLKTGTIL